MVRLANPRPDAYLLVASTQRLPLARNQPGAFADGDAGKVGAGLALGEEKRKLRHGPLDLAVVLDVLRVRDAGLEDAGELALQQRARIVG